MTDLESTLSALAEAAPLFAATPPAERARALATVADRLDAAADEIVALGGTETGLAEGRLRAELNRTTAQLRLFAEVVVEGAYLDARVDEPDPDYVVGPRPDVRRVNMPLGPVLNFAASNFPLAFSVAGGDTAAALAAGCPVLVKAHDGHPRLSRLTGDLVRDALDEAGMPAGVFAVIEDRDDAVAALRDERIRAGSFTGSTAVGTMLAGIAAERATPIPFYGELGSVNPVFVTAAALREDPKGIAEGYVASVTGSAGQLCTKPGFCFVPDTERLQGPLLGPLLETLTAAAERVGAARLLTPGIAHGYRRRHAEVLGADGVEVLVAGTAVEAGEHLWVTPTIVRIGVADLERAGEAVLDETFGPLSVLVTYDDPAALPSVAERLFHGSLTATVQHGTEDRPEDLAALVAAASRTAGRVLFNGWPTGVSVTAAMQHGGPHPATTTDATSVGTAAIGRFLRAVAFQNAPAALLPAPLRDDNPWGVPQRRSRAGLSAGWGSLSGRY